MAAPRALCNDSIQCIECGEMNRIPESEAGIRNAQPSFPSGNETIAVPVADLTKPCPACAATVLRHVSLCQKCGFDFRSAPQPAETAAPKNPSFWNPFSVAALAIFTGLVLIAVVIMFGMPRKTSLPSTPPPPLPLPPPAAILPPAETNRTVDAFDSFDFRADFRALDCFTRYELQLQQGNLLVAFHIFRDLQACYTNAADLQVFLNKTIPPEDQRLLTLASLCRICRRGVCQVCQGSGICLACEGDRECRECGGMGLCERQCAACSCLFCRNSGLCPICKGNKTVLCQQCQGTGKGNPVARRNPCPTCKGKGKVPLLKGEITCLKCKGNGYLPEAIAPACPSCSGQGTISCSACRGTGLCPRCRQNTWTVCNVCHGIGKTVTVCSFCRGNGTCPRCGERGFCPACRGAGICPACQGASVIVSHRFLVRSAWLTQDHGVMLYDTRERRLLTASLQTGSITLAYRERPVLLNVASNELVCLFNEPAYQWTREFALSPSPR